MSVIVANNCTIINVFHETKLYCGMPIILNEPFKYRLERLKTPTTHLDNRRKIQKHPQIITNKTDNEYDFDDWKQCAHCRYKTRFLGNLWVHIKAMHSHDRTRVGKFEKYHYFQCALCPYGSKHKQALKNHMIARHCGPGNEDECPKCHTVMKNKMCVRSHLQYCGKSPAHQCPHCTFKTRYRTHLSRHLANVHNDCNSIDCPNNCGSVLKNKESLRGHLNFCGTEPFSVQCRYCPFRPKRRNLLKLHVLRVHSDVTNITNQCPKCFKKFKKGGYLRKHIPTCDSKRVYQCDICSYMNHKKDLLERHIQQKHLDDTSSLNKTIPFLPCPRCDVGFKNRTLLSEHLLRCGDQIGYQCYHCPFKTKIKDQLKNHILCAHIAANELYQINMSNYIQNPKLKKTLAQLS